MIKTNEEWNIKMSGHHQSNYMQCNKQKLLTRIVIEPSHNAERISYKYASIRFHHFGSQVRCAHLGYQRSVP